MVRHTDAAADESTTNDARVSTPDYRADADLAEVDEGDRVTFTTRTNRSNGVPLTDAKTLTADDVTVDERESTEMVEVDPAWFPADSRFGGDPDRVESASVPRTATERHVEVVAIDPNGDRPAYRYTLRQIGDDVVRVSSCKQDDFERQANGVRNAVADSNVSHGYITSWEHKPVATDGGVTTTRRTRADLRYLADVVTHTRVDTDAATDSERNRRLIDHGWVTSQGTSTTGDGHRVAGVVGTLRNRDAEYDDFDMAVDAMGMADFVDACVEAPSIQDAVSFVRGVFVCANTADEARHDAGTQADEYDHDGMFAPHLADFDARNGTVEVRFERESTARSWVGYVSRYDPEFAHDKRFTSNRNPRRVVADVTDY